ncbi:MAG TPA: hypothetical protein VF426_12445, partial [Marmoricola sp.]
MTNDVSASDWARGTFARRIGNYDFAVWDAQDPQGAADILRARQIQGEDYVRSGYIEPSKLDAHGVLADADDALRTITYVIARRTDT